LASRSVQDFRGPDSLSSRVGRQLRNALIPRWGYAIAAIAVFSVIVGWVRWHSTPSYADKLLAQAYSEQRSLELRISGARHAPLRVQKGEDRSRFERPLELLEAEEVIAKKLVQDPNDPAWLQAKARAELLDGNYESAVQALQRALETASPGGWQELRSHQLRHARSRLCLSRSTLEDGNEDLDADRLRSREGDL
jgi:tetratricopeptide (TPR) repeat protein